MTIHQALHPKQDTDSLYVRRKGGGRGLANIKDCVDVAI